MPSCPCYRRVDLRKWPDLCCFCVAPSRPAQPSRRHPSPDRVGLPRGHWRTAATTHQPARRPAASGAMLGITYRDEQTCAKRFEPRITMLLCLARGGMTFRWMQFRGVQGGALTRIIAGLRTRQGWASGMGRKLLLEIMRRFVALPWVRKLGPLAPSACADRRRRGFRRFGGSGRGGRCRVVLACRRPSPFDLGPFEAGY
jgi:hypothetical protein